MLRHSLHCPRPLVVSLATLVSWKINRPVAGMRLFADTDEIDLLGTLSVDEDSLARNREERP